MTDTATPVVADTAAPVTASADSQTSAPSNEPTTPAHAPAVADNAQAPAKTASSSTTNQPQTATIPASDPQLTLEQVQQALGIKNPEDLKRVSSLSQLYGRQAQELGEARKRMSAYEGLPPADQLREQLAQQREAAEQAQLPKFHARHPDHAQIAPRITLADNFQKATRHLDQSNPEHNAERTRIAQNMGVRQSDLDLFNEQFEYRDTMQRDFAADPVSAIDKHYRPIMEQAIEQRLNGFLESWQAQHQADSFMKENDALIQSHRTQILELMNKGLSRNMALDWVKQTQELSQLRGSVGQAADATRQAQAQQAALQKRSRVTRDLATTPSTQTALEAAEARGLKAGTIAHTRFVMDFNA